MARLSKAEKLRRLDSVVTLLRNTTWKCGRLEKAIVKQLRQVRRAKMGEILRRLSHEDSQEVWDAVKRLHSRRIIEIK